MSSQEGPNLGMLLHLKTRTSYLDLMRVLKLSNCIEKLSLSKSQEILLFQCVDSHSLATPVPGYSEETWLNSVQYLVAELQSKIVRKILEVE